MKKVISKTKDKEVVIKEEAGETVIEETQNVDHILDYNKRQQNDYVKGSLIGNTQRHQQHVAEIPVTIYYQLLKKFGHPNKNQKAWKKYLNDPDNRYLRTGGGKL
jgi:hypothetical protein|tara:strand:+ start:944 stop:1258 length:315 start_codon:yes stop_codon:yes gene_type:complete